jgi:hypothetical protein
MKLHTQNKSSCSGQQLEVRTRVFNNKYPQRRCGLDTVTCSTLPIGQADILGNKQIKK